MKGQFDFDVRILMCRNCGAPLKTGFTGGSVTCEYCGTTNHFSPRKEEPVEPVAAAVEMDEEERLELLRRQDGIQPELPTELKPLISNGRLAPWKESEALTMWQATCKELAVSNDYANAELLYYLTIILSNHFSGKEDDLRERALYESALEVLTLPRHRQLMRGYLTRNAALGGDLEAAENWLAPCNPRSQDLESDSSYRISKAEIETVRENWQGVLDILGESINDVPITAALDGKAIVQRANALEHLGRVDDATQQLAVFLQANGAMGRDALRTIRSIYTDAGIEMCPVSSGKAESTFTSVSGKVASQMANPGGCFGQIFTITGIFMILLGIVLTFVLRSHGQSPPIAAALGPGSAGIIFLLIGIRHVRAGNRVKRLHEEGIDGRARVESIEPTGWKINDVPQYLLKVQVMIEGRASYQASAKLVLSDEAKQRFSRGAEISVKVDPRDPQNISVIG